MTTQPVSAGYIVYDNEHVIHGLGATADEAWADFRTTMAAANITVLDDDDDAGEQDGSWTRASGIKIQAATAALIAMVNGRGGNCAWVSVDGVACTRDEAED